MDKEKREALITEFNVDNAMATNQGVFGLPFGFDESEIILYPVPWEVTVSYRTGTAAGPMHLYEASPQIELLDPYMGEPWKKGLFWFDAHITEILRLNNNVRPIAMQYLTAIQQGAEVSADIVEHINHTCAEVKEMIKNVASSLLQDGRKMAIVGGDHSTPLGLIEALADQHGAFGILQIDAHPDLREAYEGFTYSHASIMHNALQYHEGITLTQVGIRDYSPAEWQRMQDDERIHPFCQKDWTMKQLEGTSWKEWVQQIVGTLPEKVYISFDVDGLDPALCPATGTPVPDGLQFDQIAYLLQAIQDSGKQVIGFDLCETGNAEWDGIVSSRLLYKLCGLL